MRTALAIVLTSLALLAGCNSNPPPLVLTEAEAASPATLLPGDPAPALAVSDWVRGDPVPAFQPGTVYVVDFWASWCGPCLASMPGLSRLQDEYRGKVVAIGLTTLDEMNDVGDVREALDELKDSVRFRIAIDAGGQTAARYRTAVRDTAIPRSFIIDQQGRFAWYGHPMDLPPVLNAVVSGTWRLDAARAEQQRRNDAAVATRAIVKTFIAASQAKDVSAQLAAAQEVTKYPVKDCAGMSPDYWGWTTQVSCLVELGRIEEARAVGATAANTPGVADEAYAMAQLAQTLQPVALDDAGRYADQSMQIMRDFETRGVATEWDKFLYDAEQRRFAACRVIVADVRAAQGRFAEAISLLESSLQVWPDNPRFIPNKTTLQRRLEDYKSRAGSTPKP